MKKAFCLLLSILLLMGCAGCAVISHSAGTPVRICYDRKDFQDVSFELDLSQEEANLVLFVLNGKCRDWDLAGTGAACGFGREQAFIVNDRVYCLGQDDCGVIWEEGTNHYYIISFQELEQLKDIFRAHGAKHI